MLYLIKKFIKKWSPTMLFLVGAIGFSLITAYAAERQPHDSYGFTLMMWSIGGWVVCLAGAIFTTLTELDV